MVGHSSGPVVAVHPRLCGSGSLRSKGSPGRFQPRSILPASSGGPYTRLGGPERTTARWAILGRLGQPGATPGRRPRTLVFWKTVL